MYGTFVADLASDASGRSRCMDNLTSYQGRPFAFVGRYLWRRPRSHAVIATAVAAAVICAVGTQYAVKFLVDSLTWGLPQSVWVAFLLLGALIGSDNLLWRAAGWVASTTFVKVTGDVRRDLFRHVTGHAPSYFSDQMPGTLTSRVTATSNAVFAIENMFVWNVLPPCLATLSAIALVATVSFPMAGVLSVAGSVIVVAMFRLAAAGKPLHHDFATKAAAVDGEMVDVVSNMPVVKAFCGVRRELDRFGAKVDCEVVARSRSLRYLERLRIAHAVVTAAFTIGLVAWAVILWQHGQATAGDVVLTCTLGLSVLHATRDLAVALVDVTQHVARLSEALETLLAQHQLRDHPEAGPLVKRGASIEFDNVSFSYVGGRRVFQNSAFRSNQINVSDWLVNPVAANRRCSLFSSVFMTYSAAESSSMARMLLVSYRTASVLPSPWFRKMSPFSSDRLWKTSDMVDPTQPTSRYYRPPKRHDANSSTGFLAASRWSWAIAASNSRAASASASPLHALS